MSRKERWRSFLVFGILIPCLDESDNFKFFRPFFNSSLAAEATILGHDGRSFVEVTCESFNKEI